MSEGKSGANQVASAAGSTTKALIRSVRSSVHPGSLWHDECRAQPSTSTTGGRARQAAVHPGADQVCQVPPHQARPAVLGGGPEQESVGETGGAAQVAGILQPPRRERGQTADAGLAAWTGVIFDPYLLSWARLLHC